MITDKDQEEIISLLSGNYSCGRTWSAWQYGTMHEDDFAPLDEDDSFIDDLLSVVDRIRAESADQARKEAAERAVAFLKKEWYWFNDDACYADELRAAILGDSVVKENLITDHIPDTGEKLAIAVKALEYVASKSMPSSVFESHYSRLQDACAKASDALKEIQG